jgi:hypothetical protein
VGVASGEIERIARELAGRHVDDVRYYTLPYGMTDRPAWDRGVAHAVDYGMDLVLPGDTIGVTWRQYGEYGYGLHLVRGPLLTALSRAEFCSVSDEPPWEAVLGQPIARTQIHWLDVTWGSQETVGPAALSLHFAGSTSIVLVCGSWTGADQAVFPTGDDIVVVWQPGLLPVLAPFLRSALPGS